MEQAAIGERPDAEPGVPTLDIDAASGDRSGFLHAAVGGRAATGRTEMRRRRPA